MSDCLRLVFARTSHPDRRRATAATVGRHRHHRRAAAGQCLGSLDRIPRPPGRHRLTVAASRMRGERGRRSGYSSRGCRRPDPHQAFRAFGGGIRRTAGETEGEREGRGDADERGEQGDRTRGTGGFHRALRILGFEHFDRLPGSTSPARGTLEVTDCESWPKRTFSCPAPDQAIRARWSRSALAMTDTELRLMATPASIGFIRIPKNGKSTPAAMGMPSPL